MASKKKTQKKAAGRASVAQKAGVSTLTPKEVAALKALPAEHGELPDAAVNTVLEEARELFANVKSKASALVDGSMLRSGFDDQLHRGRDLLERAETMWTAARSRTAPQRLKLARSEGESLKKETMAALRYFAKSNAEVQSRLDQIAEGTGDDDTVNDLRQLAMLATEHAALLKKAKKLPPKLTQALTKAADALSMAVAEEAGAKAESTDDGDETINLRNRAYWALKQQMDDIRDAGRYVFRGDKRALKHFKSTQTRARNKKKDDPKAPG